MKWAEHSSIGQRFPQRPHPYGLANLNKPCEILATPTSTSRVSNLDCSFERRLDPYLESKRQQYPSEDTDFIDFLSPEVSSEIVDLLIGRLFVICNLEARRNMANGVLLKPDI